MDKKTIHLIWSISMMVLGILMILLGLFGPQLPHGLRIAVSLVQILLGGGVIYTSILKIRGNF